MNTEIIKINDVTDTISSWINRDFVSDELRESLRAVNCLFVPYEGRGISDKLVFPKGMSPFFNFLKNNLSDDSVLSPDLCIDDENFLELHMHGKIEDIGKIVIDKVALPVFVTLLSTYLIANFQKDKDIDLRFKVIVQEDGKSVQIDYNGPKEDAMDYFNKALNANDLLRTKAKECR